MTKTALIFSDVHLGNKRTSTSFIISNIVSNIHYYIENNDVDVVFIGGDLLDRLLSFPEAATSIILVWFYNFLLLCHRRNVSIRILEGTPSHDWKQVSTLMSLVEMIKSMNPKLYEDLDIKYFDDVTIERNERLGMNILYVPDEWGVTSEYTLNHVKNLLQTLNLDNVDLAIMHGLFDYQVSHLQNLPSIKSVHNSTEYLSIVNRYISIGHDHHHTFHDRIFAQGSFDRLAHNEEAPKGFVVMKLENDPKDDSFVFIENKGSKVYKSITLKGNDINKAIKQIDSLKNKLPEDSHIRVIMKKSHPLNNVWDNTYKTNVLYNFSKKVIDENEENKNDTNRSIYTYNGFNIDQTNVVTLVEKRLDENDIPLLVKENSLKLLQEFKDELIKEN